MNIGRIVRAAFDEDNDQFIATDTLGMNHTISRTNLAPFLFDEPPEID
jgi:hypothetical protein